MKKIKFEYEGVLCEYQYFPRRRKSRPYLKIYAACKSPGDYEVGKESGFDRFFQKIGIAAEIQTGDQEFDQNFYIQADHVEFARQFFSFPARREAVRELFRKGISGLKYNGKVLAATIQPFESGPACESFLKLVMPHLKILMTDLPQDFPQMAFSGIPVWKLCRGIFYTVSFLALGAGFCATLYGALGFPPLDGWDVFHFSLHYTVSAFVVFNTAAVLILKGRSSSHYELILIFFVSLFGFALTGYGGSTVLNGYWDTGKISSHDCQVVHKWVSRSKDSKTYYLSLMSWRPGKSTETISVPYSLYKRSIPRRSMITVETKPGYLGFEWIADYHFKSEAVN